MGATVVGGGMPGGSFGPGSTDRAASANPQSFPFTILAGAGLPWFTATLTTSPTTRNLMHPTGLINVPAPAVPGTLYAASMPFNDASLAVFGGGTVYSLTHFGIINNSGAARIYSVNCNLIDFNTGNGNSVAIANTAIGVGASEYAGILEVWHTLSPIVASGVPSWNIVSFARWTDGMNTVVFGAAAATPLMRMAANKLSGTLPAQNIPLTISANIFSNNATATQTLNVYSTLIQVFPHYIVPVPQNP